MKMCSPAGPFLCVLVPWDGAGLLLGGSRKTPISSARGENLERNLDGFKQESPFCWDTFELQTTLLMISTLQIHAEFLLDRGTWGDSCRVFAGIFASKHIPSGSHALPVSNFR